MKSIMEESLRTPFLPNISNQIDAHILVVPYPIQGHVGPMMKLSECIASHGIKVTAVTTEHNYERMIDGVQRQAREGQRQVRLVAVPDGLTPEDDRKDEAKVAASIRKVMPGHIYDLVAKSKQQQNEPQISCLIVDAMFVWALDVADEARIKLAVFWTSSPGTLAVTLRIPELIQSGIIDQEGTLLKEDEIQVLPNMPNMSTLQLPWHSPDDPTFEKTMFSYFCAVERIAKQARWLLCNWFQELVPSASISIPNLLPIGPLLANGKPSLTLKPEDTSCLTWLDKQPLRSVIYVAFGSLSTLTQKQLNELSYGLQLSGCRFLWVVRAGLTGDSPVKFTDGFESRADGHGKIVEWAPQEKVLAHPSIACFLTHCGWNSTMEGLSNGVPLLCWPCFADQPYTSTCISNAWKIGINLVLDVNNGIILWHEIKGKIDKLMSCDDIIGNSLKLKEIARRSVAEEGSSFALIQGFIEETQC